MNRLKKIRWQLAAYDSLILIISEYLLLVYSGWDITNEGLLEFTIVAFAAVYSCRLIGNVYGQIWRYGGIQCYILLIFTDAVAFWIIFVFVKFLHIGSMPYSRIVSVSCVNLLGSLTIRMFYRYAYKCGSEVTTRGRLLLMLLRIFGGRRVVGERTRETVKTNIAIIGAGRVGVSLAEDLLANTSSVYNPCCFIDVSSEKVGRSIHGIPVLNEDETTMSRLRNLGVQEVVLAVPHLTEQTKKSLYEYYSAAGCKIKVYELPTMRAAGGKPRLREFDIEDLLFRKTVDVVDERTYSYYRGKVILITGGGGSIGSELCRQIAKMLPKQLIILDIYENCAYDIQQELRMAYPMLDINVEIVSITNKRGLARVFRAYRPDIVINAAAHKHVPLMEKNCIEAVENNVFGTLNVVQCCEEFHTERFMMVSTDKAVNPTNVMGATKRMCEMIVQAYSTVGNVKYSATRFGNVLGSAGSVIPLFRRQIAAGGPVTLTDKRIVRYFMTIPEASQLVLASGAMADNGELFVLDMGKPVRIYDLARNMIHLSGAQDISIVETGLRPGEKLYEELLVKTEELDKTDNSLIFIERDVPITMDALEEKLTLLRDSLELDSDEAVRIAMRLAVPTFRPPEEVNSRAAEAEEMKNTRQAVPVG